jgi:hypothetical protein
MVSEENTYELAILLGSVQTQWSTLANVMAAASRQFRSAAAAHIIPPLSFPGEFNEGSERMSENKWYLVPPLAFLLQHLVTRKL